MSSSHILIKLIDHTQGQMWFIFGNIWLGEFLFCYCRPLIFYNIKVHFLKGWLVKWPIVLGVFFGQLKHLLNFQETWTTLKSSITSAKLFILKQYCSCYLQMHWCCYELLTQLTRYAFFSFIGDNKTKGMFRVWEMQTFGTYSEIL